MGSRNQGFQTLQSIAQERLISSFFEYSNARTLLTFLCLDCGNPYKTTAFLYKKSNDSKCCTSCRKRLKVNDPDSREIFIRQCKNVHGDYYDYSLIPNAFTATEKITIICPKHGHIQTTSDQHKNKGTGCSHCKIDKITSVTRSSKTEFQIKANNIHNFRYGYADVKYINAKTLIEIRCHKHGVFSQTPDVHLRGSGCPRCTHVSKPITSMLQALDRANIEYSTEKTFVGCRSKQQRTLRFDIYIPEKNLCVEYDGVHHFQPTKFSSSITDTQAIERFHIQQENDSIKDEYCNTYNIKLIRIPFTDFNPDATLIKYISELENERFMYTWEDLRYDSRSIIDYIKTFNYSAFAVYGISRGGLPFAVPVSNHFDDLCEFGIIKFQRYDNNDKVPEIQILHTSKDIPIFVIDDLISSGETMRRTIKTLQHRFKKATIHPIVIFGDENNDNIFFIKEHPKQWIVFPYEI